MRRVAVIGDKDSIYGFSALGLDIYPISNNLEGERELKKIILKNSYAVIYITEALAQNLKGHIDIFQKENEVSIVPIPGLFGNNGIGMKNVVGFVKKAVGTELDLNANN
ncbi:MAG: V-type sodium ATPase subunit F [Eubacteriales bacterium SKADARSKE-1]|nr:V-type sodium ATPase subunit F [Eubacteriales bacterium SKADARSKE-1]